MSVFSNLCSQNHIKCSTSHIIKNKYSKVFLFCRTLLSHDLFTVEYNGRLYVFGGYNGVVNRHFNDLHMFDPGNYIHVSQNYLRWSNLIWAFSEIWFDYSHIDYSISHHCVIAETTIVICFCRLLVLNELVMV